MKKRIPQALLPKRMIFIILPNPPLVKEVVASIHNNADALLSLQDGDCVLFLVTVSLLTRKLSVSST